MTEKPPHRKTSPAEYGDTLLASFDRETPNGPASLEVWRRNLRSGRGATVTLQGGLTLRSVDAFGVPFTMPVRHHEIAPLAELFAEECRAANAAAANARLAAARSRTAPRTTSAPSIAADAPTTPPSAPSTTANQEQQQ